MRTKTLLTAVAALAAGIITSQAQVYSANIVGYVTEKYVPGFANVANPMDIGAGNSLTNVIANPGGALDGTLVYVWNGSGYTIYTIDSSMSTGLGDSADNNPVASPTINPGQMIFFANNIGSPVTNIVTGTVHVEGGQTGSNVGATTNLLAPGYNFVASKVSVGGGVSSNLQLSNPGGVIDGCLLYVPNISNGNFLGYTISTFDSSFGTGFGDSADNNQVAEPQIPVGTGFVFFNNTGSPYNWVQQY